MDNHWLGGQCKRMGGQPLVKRECNRMGGQPLVRRDPIIGHGREYLFMPQLDRIDHLCLQNQFVCLHHN